MGTMDVNIVQARDAIQDIIEAGLVPHLVGSPGLGKSDLIRQVAKENNLKIIDFRLAQADPTDLMGFPTLNEDRTRSHYAPPSTFPLEHDTVPDGYQGWLVFFDEMNSAPMANQAASYKIILDRMIGDVRLHPRVVMACAGNKTTDKAIVNRLSTAMQSRMVHLNLAVDADAWFEWAISAKVDPRIIGFLRFREELLHNFDPNHDDDTFPCPRTWEFLSKMVKKWEKVTQDKMPTMVGTVGEGAAMEFKGFTEIYESLPTLNEIMSRPDTVDISEEPSILYAMTALIGSRADVTNVDVLMKVVNRLPVEFQVITMQNILKNQEDKLIRAELMKQKSVKIWVSANASELV